MSQTIPATPDNYLAGVIDALHAHWPGNRTVNIVCHGHSVPAGYFATPLVDTFNAYPHLLHRALKERFPFAITNVIVTAIGGGNSVQGVQRFADEVLCHRPDVLTIDYGLNDRGIGLPSARTAWSQMIQQALSRGTRILLLTPTPDRTQLSGAAAADRELLRSHAAQIRALAGEFGVGLVESLAAFDRYVEQGSHLNDLLSWPNHPNAAGHALVTKELLKWFPA